MGIISFQDLTDIDRSKLLDLQMFARNLAKEGTSSAQALVYIIGHAADLASDMNAPADHMMSYLQYVMVGTALNERTQGQYFYCERGDGGKLASYRFGDSGFKVKYKDASPQIEHAIGGLVLGYEYGRIAGFVLGYGAETLEAYVDAFSGTEQDHLADYQLYNATVPLGAALDDNNYVYLSNAVREGVGDDTILPIAGYQNPLDQFPDYTPLEISGNSSYGEDIVFTDNKGDVTISNPYYYGGVVYGFVSGDTIDLAHMGIATGATIGANNVLAVTGGNGGTVALRLDPTHDYTSQNPVVEPDGDGGTRVTLNDIPIIAAPSSIELLAGQEIVLGGVTLADADADIVGSEDTLTVIVSDLRGQLWAGQLGGATVKGSGSAKLTVTGSLGAVNAELRTLAYASPQVGESDTITLTATDGHGGESSSNISVDIKEGDLSHIEKSYSDGLSPSYIVYTIEVSAHFIGDEDLFDGRAHVHNDAEVSGSVSFVEPSSGSDQFDLGQGFLALTGLRTDVTDGNPPVYTIPISATLSGIAGFQQSNGTQMAALYVGGGGSGQPIDFFGGYVPHYQMFVYINPQYENIMNTNGERVTIIEPGTYPIVTDRSSFSDSNYIFGRGVYGVVSVSATIACFVLGTRITSPAGELNVEDLTVGQYVTLASGGMGLVKWLGHRSIDCSVHPKPHCVWPVHIFKHAFGPGLPQRDLWLSPDHAVLVGDVLVPIRHLINGTTILQEPWDKVTYYHVELSRHDVLLAEGLPCESYLDVGDRSNFENGSKMMRPFPDFLTPVVNLAAIWEVKGCAPLVVHGPELEAARALVSAQIGGAAPVSVVA